MLWLAEKNVKMRFLILVQQLLLHWNQTAFLINKNQFLASLLRSFTNWWWWLLLFLMLCKYINRNITVGVWQGHFYGFTYIVFLSLRSKCVLFYIICFNIFWKKDGQLYESSAIESFDLGGWINRHSGQSRNFQWPWQLRRHHMAIILLYILKGVSSVALLCEWLQPLTSKECLTSVMCLISQILKSIEYILLLHE